MISSHSNLDRHRGNGTNPLVGTIPLKAAERCTGLLGRVRVQRQGPPNSRPKAATPTSQGRQAASDILQTSGTMVSARHMSDYIPVFTAAVDCSTVVGRDVTYDVALSLIPENPWLCTSRNWWYQGLVAKLLQRYADFSDAKYLTQVVAVVSLERLPAARKAIQGLIEAIDRNPEPFIAAAILGGAPAEEIRRNIAEATISRDIDDDCRYAFENFFSFLASQVAALEETERGGKCLIYVQSQP